MSQRVHRKKQPQLAYEHRKVMDVIRSYITEKHYSPTVREITDEAGFGSLSTTHTYITDLIAWGYLGRGRKGIARTLHMTEKANGIN